MTKRAGIDPLPPEKLRRSLDPAALGFETTDELKTSEKIIGQERALEAIRLGLGVPSDGYNIFVAGHVGTGRNTTIDRFLGGLEHEGPPPPDLLYVHNFKDPDRPRLLTLPAGRGTEFRRTMDEFVEGLRKGIPAIFRSDEYDRERKAVLEGYQEQEKALIRAFEQKVEAEHFALVQVQMGPIVRQTLVPVVAGNPMSLEDLHKLTAAGQFPHSESDRLMERHAALSEEMEKLQKQVREINKEALARLARLDSDLILPVVHDPIARMRSTFPREAVDAYLDEVEEDVLSTLDRFRDHEEAQEPPWASGPTAPDPFLEYRVNVIVDNARTKGAPVVTETSPTYKNLFGAIEKALDRSGEWRTDFMRIRAGSLQRANGGYLVLNAMDVLREGGVWSALKRCLRNRIAEIQSYDPFFMLTTSVLKPEPIPCSVKVVMVGERMLYHLLFSEDPDFGKIFKVKAEFDTVMKATPGAVSDYAAFIAKIARSEGLLAFDRSGAAAVVEHGLRKAGRRDRLTTRFVEIADVVREASWHATKAGARAVGSDHVRRALAGRRQRVSLAEEKMHEAIEEGTLLIDVSGEKVGQVNGLSVFDLGDFSFGLPSRITATVSMGRAGIVNIEREAELSGPAHNKGVLILSGWLRDRFAQERPLTLSASLCFEQSYGGVEGDSASSTEIYALLSAISGLPIRQDLAVTGSVDQKGEIQPIGGVNEKIEGWFAICRARGLTGTQGVMIPQANVEDLMLTEEVVEAVRDGKFAIYAVSRVEQGIELLTGMPAGERYGSGRFPEETVYVRVDARLRELAEGTRAFEPPGGPSSL